MPAPFVIAHLQIASLLETAHAPLTDQHRAGVFLTNALTGWVPERHPQSVIFAEFQREREDSEQIKQHGTILVILGNPPYNGYAGIASIDEERDLTNAYREAIPGLPAPQGQGLNDLYVRFFRIAERRIVGDAHVRGNQGSCGIVSFISNYSWLDGLSHTTMRDRYLNTFDDIYIDNLHGDRKISEYAPDGRTSETVFAITGTSVGIKIGTAISTLVRKAGERTAPEIRYRDFEEARASERREALLRSIGDEERPYTTLTPNRILGLPFKPRTVETAYLDWPRLPDLFPTLFPGVKTSRDALLVDIDLDQLEARMTRYLGTTVPDAGIAREIPAAMEDTGRFDATTTRRTLQQKGYRPWQIMRYAYRPFDVRWLYWEPETKLLDEKRSDYVSQALVPSPCLAAQQKSRGDSCAPQLISPVGCLDLLDRGASCFPAVTVQSAGTLLSAVEVRPNLGAEAETYLESVDAPKLTLFHHSLATMHTPAYRAENAGALLSDWPRIPLPATADLLIHSASLGRRLAELLDAESAINLAAEWSFLAALKLPRDPNLDEALKLTAGWGHKGQGSAVNPGRGLAPERPWTDAEREKLAALAAAQSLTTDDTLTLLGEACVDVYLNGDSHWAAVPTNVWNYTLGGYQVLKKWLSYREFTAEPTSPLLHRALRPEEAAYFAQVVRRIAAILLLGPALDASYRAILPTATALPAVPPR
jgi:predicted helicase